MTGLLWPACDGWFRGCCGGGGDSEDRLVVGIWGLIGSPGLDFGFLGPRSCCTAEMKQRRDIDRSDTNFRNKSNSSTPG